MSTNKTVLSKNLMCVKIQGDIEIWSEKENVERFQEILSTLTQSTFLKFEGQTINSAYIIGVFTAEEMEIATRHKNGEWKCKFGFWHDNKEVCECEEVPPHRQFFLQNEDRYKATWAKCPRKCSRGEYCPHPDDPRTQLHCDCQKELDEERVAWVAEHFPNYTGRGY